MGLGPDEVFCVGKACPACKGTGARGRRMTHELSFVSPALRQPLVEEADTDVIAALAGAGGVSSRPRPVPSQASAPGPASCQRGRLPCALAILPRP